MSPNSANVGAEQTTQDENDAILAEEQKRLVEEAKQKRLAEAAAEEQKRLAEEAAAEQQLLADKLAAAKQRQQEAAKQRQQEAAKKAAKENQRLAEQTIQQAKIDTENKQINDICAKLPDISARPSSGSIISNDYNNIVYDIKDLPNLYNIDFTTFYKVTTDNVTITKIKVTPELHKRIQQLCSDKLEYFYTPKQSAGRRHKKYTKKRR
jgi:flagellar biosynthesis GTPase FlhF